MLRQRKPRLGLWACFIACALARVPAAPASFEPPYDPDFAPKSDRRRLPQKPKDETRHEPTRAEQTASETSAEPPVETAIPVSAEGFLLLDRPQRDEIFERPAEAKPAGGDEAEPRDFLDFEKDFRPLEYSEAKFRRMRANAEAGLSPLDEGLTPYISEETVLVSSSAPPKPPPPELELPTYGTSLSVTGRKIIGFQFSEKRFLNDQAKTGRPASTNLFEINQELQLRMQGKVGPKITVNVDYDDTKLNHQDISVVYTGDPNEVVQNVSFGDIDLSLPPTEFVSYNKQLFGIRADIKWKGLKASFIGSRTKGTTKSKRFYGNTQFIATDLLDTAYVRRQHYDLTFGNAARLPIRSASERVFLARQVAGQTNVNEVILTANDLGVQTSSFTGKFVQLSPGVDYTIDYVNGILSFRTQLQPQYVVAVDFIDASGNSITVQTSSAATAACAPSVAGTDCFNAPRLVKTSGDVFISTASELGYRRELKTVYSLGQQNIVRDNGRGNFILQVINPQRAEVGSTLNPVQKYPDTIVVDFENGTFRLKSPFAVSTDSSVPDPDLYSPTPVTKRLIHVEYSFRFKTFFLEPNLVPQSEVVLLDGVKMNRNVDYFIDYEAGFITFFNEDRIRTNSEIGISFEVAPFIGVTNDSLLGTRVSYDFTKNFSLGSTLLYQAGAKSPTVPHITELARSLFVYEVDAKLSNLKLLPKLKLASFAGEFAQSRQNPNLNQAALIDNMEGVKQEEAAPMLSQSWLIAANPGGAPTHPDRLSWQSEDVRVLDINPRAQAGNNETQMVLAVSADFGNPLSTEASVVFPFSATGVDMSQKTILEFVMLGDNSGNELNFHLGGINEDADADGALDTEDVNKDGLLQPEEDIGWLYNPAAHAPASKRFVAGNGRIDSEDLNGNGALDAADFTGDDFGYSSNSVTGAPVRLFNLTDNTFHDKLDFSGWKTFQIPLNVSSATFSRWTNIKQIRVSVRKRAAGNATTNVKFARIAVVGNSWLPGTANDPATNLGPVASENLTVTPVNSVDNPTYTPIFNAGGDATEIFNALYGSLENLRRQANAKNLSEQALQLDFSSMTVGGGRGAIVTTKRQFPRAIDVSQHKFFRFLVYGNADDQQPLNPDHEFFFRVGNDTNFFEIRKTLNFSGWKKIEIEQIDTNGDSVMDNWSSKTDGGVITSSGTPSLSQVANIVVGVRRRTQAESGASADNVMTRGRLYINEIHVAEPVTRVGTAKKLEANFEIPGWAAFGGKYREIDRNFQTPTSVLSNQDNRQDNAYLNFSRLSFFPMTFNLARVITETPSPAQTGNLSNIVTQLQAGKVVTWTGGAQGNFALGALPRVGLAHTRNRIEYKLLTRLDDRRTYTTSLQYGVPLSRNWLPHSVDANYGLTLYDVSFERLDVLKQPGNFNTKETTQNFGLRLTFTPWTGSSFNPTYALTRVYEKRQDFTGPELVELGYPKSRSQSVGFSSNYRLRSWFNPQVNYQIDALENNILNVSTFVVSGSTYVFNVGDIKTVNRSANGTISLPLTIGEIWRRARLFRSVTIVSGYQIQDGDIWNNVENTLDTATGLWVRTPLKPRGPAAVRNTLTLRDTWNSTQRWSPLDAYNIAGRLAAFKTLALSNNFVKSLQRSDVTGTQSRTISTTLPDAVASLGQLEQLLHTERWMASTQMNYKYSRRKTENVGASINTEENFGTDLRSIIRKRFDTLLSFNQRKTVNTDLRVDANTQRTIHHDATAQTTFEVRKFRFTPKTEYTRDVSELGTGVETQNVRVITPSVLMRADLALPRGLRLPGSAKTLLFTNRIIWTTTVALADRRSPVTIADNSRLLTFNTSGDYEIAKNLRMTLNGAMSRLWHRFLKEEDFISYQFGTTLTFQF